MEFGCYCLGSKASLKVSVAGRVIKRSMFQEENLHKIV